MKGMKVSIDRALRRLGLTITADTTLDEYRRFMKVGQRKED